MKPQRSRRIESPKTSGSDVALMRARACEGGSPLEVDVLLLLVL